MTRVRKYSTEELPAHVTAWLQRKTLLGSVPFADLWRTLGGEPVYWGWLEDDRLTALLPSVQFGGGRLARLQAMPDGLYARLFFVEDTPDHKAVAASILQAIASEPYSMVFVNDYHSQFDATPGFEKRECLTSLTDVTSENWQPPDKKLQSEIRKARREEVPVRDFSLNRHLDGFLDLMTHTERRHGRQPKYPPKFYHALGKLSMSDTRIHWLVCEADGTLAASHIYFVEGDMLLNWQVFFDKRFSALKPNQLITFSVTHELKPRGIRVLNLGSSPEDADTLTYYKDKWGGETYRYNCWFKRSWLGRLL